MKDAKEKLTKAIETLADKINKDVDSNDALKYTQAALNAANAIRTLKSED